jgi:hypothetical protein
MTIAASAAAIAFSAVAATSGWSSTATSPRAFSARTVARVHAISPALNAGAVHVVSSVRTVSAVRLGAALAQTAPAAVLTTSQHLISGTGDAAEDRESRFTRAREVGGFLLHRFGWRDRFQFRFLNWLWARESKWDVYANNPYSGGYGIPQAVPGWKMSSAGANWRTSARTQIIWGLQYIKARYGSPRAAWNHECAYGWY